MQYVAHIFREGNYLLAEFPDCPGCQTFAEADQDLLALAREALEGWLEAHLVDGQIPPRPRMHYGAPATMKVARVPVRSGLAAALNIRWARRDAGLTQHELGKLAGVSQQQIAKLENPDENPSLETLDKVAAALRLQIAIQFEPLEDVVLPPHAGRAAERASRQTEGKKLRRGIHFVCRDDKGVSELADGTFESRAWRVSRANVEAAEYIALHQSKASPSYRQGRIIGYRFDTKRPDRYVFVCEAEPTSLAWPGNAKGTNMMAIKRG
jgi:transcriptional regulator with XRE-family HTH domain/predicted RNase H-like HicB family nuclease